MDRENPENQGMSMWQPPLQQLLQQQQARRVSLCLGAAQSLALLLTGLEASMAKLGGCVDELQLDVLKRPP